MNKGTVTAIIVLCVIGLGLWFYFGSSRGAEVRITSFEECVAAGFPVMESYPEQCNDGRETFVRDIGNELEKTDLIRINSPRPGGEIVLGETTVISGEARGYWFFEADFPFKILDSSGEEVFTHYATAEGDWMTEEFVPFRAEVVIESEYTGSATLVLMRSNASGLPEHDDELFLPIVIRAGTASGSENENGGQVSGECFVGGCSSQICSDNPDVVSTCEWREEYGCYRTARCERQASGQCGWTETAELMQCLSNARNNSSFQGL